MRSGYFSAIRVPLLKLVLLKCSVMHPRLERDQIHFPDEPVRRCLVCRGGVGRQALLPSLTRVGPEGLARQRLHFAACSPSLILPKRVRAVAEGDEHYRGNATYRGASALLDAL